MRLPLWGAAVALLLTACQYEITPSVPDAGGPFVGDVSLVWAPTTYGVTANFTEPQFAQDVCPGTRAGDCCAFSQPQIEIPTGGVEPITVSAGTLSVDDGQEALGSFGFQGIGYVPLSSAETPSLSWNPGDTLSVSASGGLVDPFQASVVAPPAFAGVSPDLEITGQIVVRLDQDFTATWTPPAAATGVVTLQLFDPTGFYVECSVPDASGSVTAPAATLGNFISGDSGYVTLSRLASQPIQVANATITLTAEATDPGLATFQ
jgi:hypothetical protein